MFPDRLIKLTPSAAQSQQETQQTRKMVENPGRRVGVRLNAGLPSVICRLHRTFVLRHVFRRGGGGCNYRQGGTRAEMGGGREGGGLLGHLETGLDRGSGVFVVLSAPPSSSSLSFLSTFSRCRSLSTFPVACCLATCARPC